MALPTVAYPTVSDSNLTLYSVKDTLTLKLAKDYTPGDTKIYVEQNETKMNLFPTVGIITLTEQCSEPEYRAVSFYYNTKNTTEFYFTDLTILPETPISEKRAGVTTVSMNVVAQHHNNIKDAIIAIEKVVGLKTDRTTRPFEGNLVQKVNYLSSIVFTPRAWFTTNKTIGIAPLTVQFTNKSFQLGEDIPDNSILYYWDFGDSTGSNESSFTLTTTSTTVNHTFEKPGLYSIRMKVKNIYGEDTVVFNDMINARYAAPDEAFIEYVLQPSQVYFSSNNYIKTPVGVPVYLFVQNAINIVTGNKYSGELVDVNGNVLDKIVEYTWVLSDNLSHGNSMSTNALYSTGGYYDVVLRTDTASQAFRITMLEKFINVVEQKNAWLFLINGTNINACEMGFLSEVFKSKQSSYLAISSNYAFLSGLANATQLVKEFKKNWNFTPKSSTPSGLGGISLIHYPSGRYSADPSTNESINAFNFNGFDETYSTYPSYTGRPWNWIPMNINNHTYFILGNSTTVPAGTSPTNMQLLDNDIQNQTYSVIQTYTNSNFSTSANSLKYNAAQYNSSGVAIDGEFSAYRSCVQNDVGYILKNLTVGTAFQIKAFYSSSTVGTNYLSTFNKLPDIIGPAKLEGQLVSLYSGLYFFNNTGTVSAFDVTTQSWATGGPGYNSVAFTDLQDTSVTDYEDETNTLVATSDNNHNAYLSFDYSNKAYIKWNDMDLTFKILSPRPTGTQWVFGTS